METIIISMTERLGRLFEKRDVPLYLMEYLTSNDVGASTRRLFGVWVEYYSSPPARFSYLKGVIYTCVWNGLMGAPHRILVLLGDLR